MARAGAQATTRAFVFRPQGCLDARGGTPPTFLKRKRPQERISAGPTATGRPVKKAAAGASSRDRLPPASGSTDFAREIVTGWPRQTFRTLAKCFGSGKAELEQSLVQRTRTDFKHSTVLIASRVKTEACRFFQSLLQDQSATSGEASLADTFEIEWA